MMIRALQIEDILELMATDIDNDFAYIRLDHGIGKTRTKTDGADRVDSNDPSKPVYIGPFSIYEPY